MNKILAFTTACALGAGAVAAQSTTQAAVVGETGNPNYPVRIQGANGKIYSCKAQVETIDGVRARRCIGAGGGDVFADSTGLAAGGAAAAVLLVAVLANDGDDSTSTTVTGDGD